jgi:glycosyltransferase involved in cell wall biosynthesis
LRAVVTLSMPRGIRSMARSIWRLRGWDRAQNVPITIPDSDQVSVIFCTWKRLERLPRLLDMLAAQDLTVKALIWDNSGQAEIVSKAAADARIPVAVHHSSGNIGGFGRFYLARAAAEAGHQAVVFVDDDQEFGPAAIRELLSAHKPRSISSSWAFRFTGKHYYTRERCAPGEAAHYLGTGAMVADAAIFTDPRLFTCPRRFWFAEDLWLCFVAQHLNGYRLYGNSAPLEEVLDGRNQWVKLWWVKERLRRYTAKRGWLRDVA